MERVERLWGGAGAAMAAKSAAQPSQAASVNQPAGGVPLEACDDRALVSACLRGSREAFDLIVERHRRSVYHLCYRFVGNHEDAADLAQDVFLRAYRGLRNFKGDASVGTWLYRISVNTSLNRLAVRTPPSEPIDATEAIADRGPDPASELLRREQSRHVRAGIARLPPKQRATLILRVYQDLSHQEIASIVGSSVGAVKANFFHALRNLKKILEEQ